MASSGALADFGRMPTSKKLMLFVVIGAVFGFIYFRFGYKPLKTDVAKVKQTHSQNVQKHTQLAQDLDNFKQLRAKKDELDEQFRRLQRALPTGAEIPAFFETIEHKLTAAGIAEAKFTRKQEEPFDEFVKVPLEVQLTGSFLQVKKFFASLVEKRAPRGKEERERIVSIENLALTLPNARERRDLQLTAKFTAVTFRQQEAAATQTPPTPGQVPPNSPEPAGAGGSTPAAPTSPPPLPSTPEGVKQRVEETMDRRVDQIDNATGSDRLKGGL
jgi:type IV pilus assembly protein PilO